MESLLATNMATPGATRLAQYKKMKNAGTSQAERRMLVLAMQKQMRSELVDMKRGILPHLEVEDDMETLETPEETCKESMDWQQKSVKIRRKKFGNLLMLSEWLEEIPDDLATQWLFLFCPEGKRCLVVTGKGKTHVYKRRGILVNTFPSLLPGGSNRTTQGNECTMLDCIYSYSEKVYYIMDILCWKNYPVTESDAEFRFYWLRTKLSEIPELETRSKINPFKFIELGKIPCSEENLASAVLSPTVFQSNLDGLMFYHKEGHYTRGVTPLVGWLKSFMLQEQLGISVPEKYLPQRPVDYVNMSVYLQGLKKSKETSGNASMDI